MDFSVFLILELQNLAVIMKLDIHVMMINADEWKEYII